MKIQIFCPSIISDRNNEHAHFLRGIAAELTELGHCVTVFEPWHEIHFTQPSEEQRTNVLNDFHKDFPTLLVKRYRELVLEEELADVDLVVVWEGSDSSLTRRIGEIRERWRNFTLLYRGTRQTDFKTTAVDLDGYDGVLASTGEVATGYRQRANQVWVWHDAADIRLFYPQPSALAQWDLVWFENGNVDAKRLSKYLLKPIKALNLKARLFGIDYTTDAIEHIQAAGATYGGWIPNTRVPRIYGQARVTAHIPSTSPTEAPTMRPLEAMACGIPAVFAPWDDSDGLFRSGKDFLPSRSAQEMTKLIYEVLSDESLHAQLAQNGLETITTRHSCTHRARELMVFTPKWPEAV